jgi:hypothetical protein
MPKQPRDDLVADRGRQMLLGDESASCSQRSPIIHIAGAITRASTAAGSCPIASAWSGYLLRGLGAPIHQRIPEVS